MSTLDAANAQNEFADALNRVARGKERVIVQRRGKPIAAVVPIEDLRLLEQLEDEIDIAEARKVLADPTETWEPLEKARKELGL